MVSFATDFRNLIKDYRVATKTTKARSIQRLRIRGQKSARLTIWRRVAGEYDIHRNGTSNLVTWFCDTQFIPIMGNLGMSTGDTRLLKSFKILSPSDVVRPTKVSQLRANKDWPLWLACKAEFAEDGSDDKILVYHLYYKGRRYSSLRAFDKLLEATGHRQLEPGEALPVRFELDFGRGGTRYE